MAQMQGSLNKYEVVFDGRAAGVVIHVAVPDEKRAKIMDNQAGNYIMFGQQIGEFGGKPYYLNHFVHKLESKVELRRLLNTKAVGYPVVMKKTLGEREYYHVDIFLAESPRVPVTHRIVASAIVPGESWREKKARRKPDPQVDLVFDLPRPATGMVALMKYMMAEKKAA